METHPAFLIGRPPRRYQQGREKRCWEDAMFKRDFLMKSP